MTAKRIKVAITRQLPEPVETRLKELFDVKLYNSPQPMSQNLILDTVRHCDVLVPTIGDRIDEHVQRAPEKTSV